MAPIEFVVISGVLPTGLTVSRSGVLEGTPAAAGTFAFTVAAIDANGNSGERAYVVTIAPATGPTIVLAPESMPEGTTGTAYPPTSITQIGGTGPATFAVTAGTLPTGLTLSADGLLSGTPEAAGSFSFVVTATDVSAFMGARSYTIVVAAPGTISPESLPAGTVGTAYLSTTLTQSGSTGPVSFAVTSGALPTGLTLSTTGTLSGTPIVAGTFLARVTASMPAT